MEVKINSTGGKGIKSLFKRLEKGTVDVGILSSEGKHQSSEMTVAQIGFFHEFGTEKVPERSFIRSTMEGQSRDIKTVAGSQYKKVLDGSITTEEGLGVLGAFTAGLIQEKFTDNDWVPNSEKTQERKGSSTPLIDTGQLRQSISFKVNA